MFFTHLYSFGYQLCLKLTELQRFDAKYAWITINYLKMSGFSFRNVRYPRYQDTEFLQLWVS